MNIQNVQDVFNQMMEDFRKEKVTLLTIQEWMNRQFEDIKKEIGQ